ncbi:hypothetical protein QYM36_002825 [Artemia franciscana]|uniref:Uncharacterized protein n=1 Tax=Artemia franciscana TaxID=6661 RepID=A0AA88LDJ5_ARTSF|nr:hypothetical protein QYM36_002825 [Artemia franciscana]
MKLFNFHGIPVCRAKIGTVYKKDIQHTNIMSHLDPVLYSIIAFDVPVDKQADKFSVRKLSLPCHLQVNHHPGEEPSWLCESKMLLGRVSKKRMKKYMKKSPCWWCEVMYDDHRLNIHGW